MGIGLLRLRAHQHTAARRATGGKQTVALQRRHGLVWTKTAAAAAAGAQPQRYRVGGRPDVLLDRPNQLSQKPAPPPSPHTHPPTQDTSEILLLAHPGPAQQPGSAAHA